MYYNDVISSISSVYSKETDMKRVFIFSLILAMLLCTMMCMAPTVFADEKEEKIDFDKLRYDDHIDMTGKIVEILDSGVPTSYKVGYGVEEGTLDDAVIKLDGYTLIATGIGTAKICVDGKIFDITVKPAPISLLLIIGQSNAEGMEGNANQSIANENGQVYSTYAKSNGLTGDAGLTVENAGNYVPSALTNEYSSINTNGTSVKLSGYPVNSLTEAGVGKYGMDSGLAYEWVRQTGEKVWVVNAAHGASSITSWQKGEENYEQTVAIFTACQQVLQDEISAGHYLFSHMGYYWNQGCADETKTAEWYVERYLAMHNNLKFDLACDLDCDPATEANTLEFGNIILVQAGHSTAKGYRKGTYEDNSDNFFMTYKELEMRGPRVAQIWMANNAELSDIHIVSTLAQDWVTMPDGTDGVADYFQSAYEKGVVDYTTQVQQLESWYTPSTPAHVKDSIHYNQIGYNEIGRESARNTLYILGILEKPDVEVVVNWLNWTGYQQVETIKSSTVSSFETLVVPLVYPCYESKSVKYTLTDGLTWKYYDILDTGVEGGALSASINSQTVKVEGRGYYSYRFELVDGELISVGNDVFRENKLTETSAKNYTLSEPILLKHSREWSVEFNSVVDSRFMALASTPSTTEGMYYFFKSKSGSGVLSIGEYKDGLYQNYGLQQSKINVDWTQPHVYCFKNVVNDDGTNIINIYIDDNFVGTATNLIINDVVQSTENTYLSGKDFVFTSIGCNGFSLSSDQMAFLEIHESSCIHDYKAKITPPTCTEQGYTTYACQCGDSYVSDYVEVIDHIYGLWIESIAPTCNSEGKDVRTCEDCGYLQYRDTRISGDPNKILVSSPVGTATYEGKILMAIGDSITAGTGVTAEERYHYLTAQALGMTNINSGTSGAVLCPGGHLPNKFDTLMTAELLKKRNVDIVTILLGVNDWDNGVVNGTYQGKLKYDENSTYYDLGVFGTDDTTTIYGAAKMWCERILELKATDGCEDIQFIFLTPVITSYNKSITYDKDWDQTKLNVFGYTLRRYCQAIMEVCAYYEIPVLDLNMYSEMYYHSETDNNVDHFGGDGIHPAANGHAMMADALVEFLLEGYSYEIRSNLGHNYNETIKEPTCTESGSTTFSCPDCYYSYVTDEREAQGHNYIEKLTPPTCTEQGYTTYACQCGDSYVSDYVDATGHNLGEWFVVIEATCTVDGENQRKCNNCNYYEAETIATLGHTYVTTVIIPTCTERGYTTYTCFCGDTYVSDYVDALGHTLGDWQLDDEYHWRSCLTCGALELDKAEHSDSDSNGACDVCLREEPKPEPEPEPKPEPKPEPELEPEAPAPTPDEPTSVKEGFIAMLLALLAELFRDILRAFMSIF